MANISQKIKENLMLIREVNKELGAEQTAQKSLLFPPKAHDHSDLYYTKTEVDGLTPVGGTDYPELTGGVVNESVIPTLPADRIQVADVEGHFVATDLEGVLDEIEDSIDLLNGVNFFDKVRGHAENQITLSGDPSPLDDITLVDGDRILVLGQTDASENGIYVVDTAGAWTRATDADQSSDFRVNKTVYISEGTDGSGQTLAVGEIGEAFVLGTSPLPFLHKSDSGTIANGSIGTNHISDEAVTYSKLSTSLKDKADKVDDITMTSPKDLDQMKTDLDAINTYPSEDASKLAGIEAGAEVNGVETVNGIAPDGAKNVVVTKASVGLGNVENVSVADMGISTATQSALDNKENAFAKNGAFNKNFGTGHEEVARGDDSRFSDERTPIDFGSAGSVQGIKQINWDAKGRVTTVVEKKIPVFTSANNLTVSFGDLINFDTHVEEGGVEIDGDFFGKNDYIQIDRETGHIVNLGEEVPVGSHVIDITFRPADIDSYKVAKQTFTLIVNALVASVQIQLDGVTADNFDFNSDVDLNHYTMTGHGRVEWGGSSNGRLFMDISAVGADLDYNIYERDAGGGAWQYIAMYKGNDLWYVYNSTERWTDLSDGLSYDVGDTGDIYDESLTSQSDIENGKFIPRATTFGNVTHITM